MEWLSKRTIETTICVVALIFAGCPQKEELSYAEATEAVSEATLDSQAAAVTQGAVEISTNFTIGNAVDAAAQELRDFVQTQLPCADISLENSSLTIEYGANPGNCVYHGNTYSGSHTITVQKNDKGEVIVEHEWDELSNGRFSVTGSATVTWNFQDQTRHIVHEATWTRLIDGRKGVGTGDRLQKALEGGVAEGIQIDGSRTWTGQAGKWDLSIQSVQMRWEDPVPQAGKYILNSPKGKTLTLAFTRLDEDSIDVRIDAGRRAFHFTVNSLGTIKDSE